MPALRAIREKFIDAKITVLAGKATADVVRIADVSDEQIAVDRVGLRDGNKAASIAEIFRLVSDVRRCKFDLVIDLHSLHETNLLGYLSGAKYRLFANRENRSFDRLANFPVRPPREDKSLHHTDRYFQVLKPLGIERPQQPFRLEPSAKESDKIVETLQRLSLTKKDRVGLFLGAGHRGRRWSLCKFQGLAKRLSQQPDVDVLVFLGPEESELRSEAKKTLSPYAAVVAEMPLPAFVAALSKLDVLVSTDTGPMHLAAVAGASVVLISQKGAPTIFLPLTDDLHVLDSGAVDDITVEEVYDAVIQSLNSREK
jgi:ADP-heptose:LPS heptosyltransferase